MKIGFFGTPEIAAYCLEKLIEKYNVIFIVATEDRPSGRHRKIHYSPVKVISQKHGIKLYQPSNLKEKDLIKNIKDENADIFVVVAYGKIIPRELFTLPPLKTINLHPSLLPKYRGAAPIQWVLINGESETGITIQIMEEKLDSGDILTQKKIPIDINMTSEDLYKIILPDGAALLVDTIELLSTNRIKPIEQEHEEATYCKKIDKNTSRIDWTKTSAEIHNLVRGLNPVPVAWTGFREKGLRVWKTVIFEGDIQSRKPGRLVIYQRKRLIVETGDGYLEVLQIQPETKKTMDALSFINGYRIKEDEYFDG